MAADYVACADDCDDMLDVRVVPCPRAGADAPPQPAPASPVAAHKERAKAHGQHDSSGKQQRATWSASIVLVVAFLSFASLGPAADMLSSVTPLCHALWRSQGVLVISAGSVAVRHAAARWRGRTTQPSPADDASPTWLFTAQVVFFSLCYGAYLVGFFVALNFTNVLDAYMFNQAHVVYLLVLRIMVCQKLPKVQYLGLVLAMVGVYFSLSSRPNLGGVIIAAAGGFAAIGFIQLAPAVQARFSLMATTACQQLGPIIMGCCVAAGASATGAAQQVSFSDPFNAHNGVFGYVSLTPRDAATFAYMIFVCGMCGIVGYTWAAANMPSLYVHAIMLLEPGMASVLGIAVGTSAVPSLRTWLGFAIVTAGSAVIALCEDHSQDGSADSDTSAADLKRRKQVLVDADAQSALIPGKPRAYGATILPADTTLLHNAAVVSAGLPLKLEGHDAMLAHSFVPP